jgi:lipid A 3-O-deacylase
MIKNLATFCVFILLLGSSTLFAQDSSALTHPGWNYGLFGGYGNGVGNDSNFHRFTFGGRIGRVLTSEHGPGILRGTFEWDAEATPLEIFHATETTYTGGITPIVWKWNFTNGAKRKVVPFVGAFGGLLVSSDNFPPGDTAHINFQTGVGVGFNAFTRSKRAITFDVRALHISNASIGNHNPGINASLQFQIGYTWFK